MKRKLHILLAVGIGLTASVGWLQAATVNVKNAAELLKAVKEANAGDTVRLAKGRYILGERLLIDKPIAVIGTIKMNGAYNPNLDESTSLLSDPKAEWPKDENGKIKNNLANLITIEKGTSGQNVLLKDFFVQNEIASGINAQSAMTTKLENIYSIHNANAGLLIHSKVEAKGLITYGNKWGGVNIDKGTPEYAPKFSFDGMTRISEPYKIWSELTNASEVIELPENADWQSYVIKGKDGEATKTYWTQSQLPVEYHATFPNKNWTDGYTFVYAEGKIITIGQSTNEGFITLYDDKGTLLTELPEKCNPTVFGGKKEGDVASSTVAMSGGKIFMLFGGGYGTATGKQAKVTGTTTINVKGGTIRNVIGGGLYYSHSENADITFSQNATVNGWLICGGFESGTTTGSNYVDFISSNNTVAKANLNIDGGKYSLIAMGGTDGAKAYIKEVTATIKNATITGGVFGNGSNGRSDKVTGTVTNCKFEGDAIEVAAINRGIVKSVSLTFDGCDFSKATNLHANLGATYRWGYDYNGSSAKVEGIPGDVSFTFKNCVNTPVVGVSDGLADANVILTGAKASIHKFEYDKDKFHTAFAINADKTWRFNNGLNVQPGTTFTKTGTLAVKDELIYNVATATELGTAVQAANEAYGTVADKIQITLAEGTYELPSQLLITKPITIKGSSVEKTILKPASSWTKPAEGGENLVSVKNAKNVWLDSLKITASKNYGLHIYNSDSVKLTYVSMDTNAAGGLCVNGSTVTADHLKTNSNTWGGIEVAKGIGVTKEPKLTISNSTINETSQIWADTDPSVAGSEKVAEWVAGTGWNMFTAKKDDNDKLQTFWSQKKKITINVTKSNFFFDDKVKNITYTVTPADVKDITVTYKTIAESPAEVKADTIKQVGSYYVIFTRATDDTYLALNDTVIMTINKKGVPTTSVKPTASTVEAGQPLSMSFLGGGKAIVNEKDVPGTFTWVDANMTVQEGKKNYAIIFTPANQGEFETSVDSIEIDAKRYFTVTTGVSANGKATISNKSTSDRYARNTVLNFVLTPETGYEFAGWNGTGKKENSYTVGQDTSFVASFAKKQFKVTTVVPANVTLTVKAGDSNIESGNKYDFGTVLVVTASTSEGTKMIKTIKTTKGSAINKGQIVLDAETEITVEVVDKPLQPQQVAVTAVEGGVVRLTADGKEVVPGSYLAQGTKVVIERTPNKGYKLSDIANAREEKTVGSSTLTITSTFVKEVYSISKTTGAGYTLSVDKTTGNYGDQVTVNYTVNPGYKGIALMVNAKEVPNGSTFTLTENTTVQAIVKEKATMTVVTDKQSYVYNGFNQAFVVKATPAGLDSLSVSYVQNGATVNPINAGTYTVQINRKEDDNFKAYNGTATLEITKAPIVITGRPTDAPTGSDAKGGTASVAGAWSTGSSKPNDAVAPMTKSLRSTTTYAIYTPSSNNYSVGYCVPASSLDMTVTTAQEGEGTVTVWDGNLQITGEGKNAVKDAELRVVATPAEGYKFDSWTAGVGDSDKSNASVVVTSSAEAIAFKAKFVAKANLTPAISEGASAVYDGTAKGTSLKIKSGNVEDGWSYTFQQGGITVVPVNAGKYDVLVTRAADTDNNACRTLIPNAFDITKATPTVTKVPTATVVKGAMLYSAEVTSGAATTDGQFVWKDADKAVTDAMTTAIMTFVPSSENYATVETNATLTKTDLQVVSFVQPENGTITVKRGETVLASGDAIAKDDKLTITAAPANGYELNGAITVTGATLADGVYTVSGNATVTVVASFKKTQGGGDPTPTPDPVPVTGISLDKTELTLTRLSTYTLIATVAPDKADNKSVKWTSSDESIATVDANGKVTAVKVGKATITVTTVDGSKMATCQVTVDFATGMEEDLANTKVYTRNGMIYINPIQPLQATIISMAGKAVYDAHINGAAQISVAKGIYIVKLTNAGNTITTKVSVY